MKKIFTSVLMACALFVGANAQDVPDNLNNYYRLTNAAFNEAMTVKGRYDFKGTVPSPAAAGSVFEIKTGKMASLAEEMDKLQQMLDAGLITQDEYMRLFMQLLSSGNTWFYGCYPLEKFSSQGVDYAEMIARLPDYADLAIEYFINNDAATIYKEHRNELTLLCVFASEIINPSNLESEATFKKWCENYLTAWRNNTVFKIYLQPVFQTPDDPEDTETPSYFTGNYYFRFHTPPYVGNMQKAQKYINNILTDNGNVTDVDTLDIWTSAKHYIMQEIARDYPVGTSAYNFVYDLFHDTMMDVDYLIGESEEGGLKFQPLPGTFSGFEGYEGPDITITADDVARCTWKFEIVNTSSPFAIQPNPTITDGQYYYSTLNTAFPYQLSSGMTAFYASAVSYEGVPTWVEISGNKIAAETPVIIRSTSANMADNKILPLMEGGETVDGNALKGVLFAQPNDGSMVSLWARDNNVFFDAYATTLAANSAYYDGALAGVESVIKGQNGSEKVFDLMGREVKDPSAKGIFIINGKKVVRY